MALASDIPVHNTRKAPALSVGERLDRLPYGQKIKTAAKMAVVQASTIKQLNAPFRTAPHGSA
jgi:hypothetical protein